jgi:cobalt-precorrin-5B (C1)-methyltransferase
MAETNKTPALRKGWSTGACATAATQAAYGALLTGRFEDPVTITLPRGETPSSALAEAEMIADVAMAAIVKDAGDDPDVTHRALIRARVRLADAGSGVTFRAGEGVGTVTLPGLPLSVGEPAINPMPRRMMAEAVARLAAAHGAPGDVEITLSVADGEKLAAHTMNARLGILGGLSILGTTGIVTPYSCAAWIAAIHQGIDVAGAAGLGHVAGATGKTSESAVRALHGLDEQALLEMGDFAGALLKYLRRHPLARLTIAGGFAKISKLAQGHMDLHSGRSEVDIAALARHLSALGAAPELVSQARTAASAGAVLALAGELPLAQRVAAQALGIIQDKLHGADIAVDVTIFDRAGKLIGHAKP